jgi:SAM-dependent MidA family methyltransferase
VRRSLIAAVERLCGHEHMGRLFKVLAVHRADLVLPPF